jgi:hypothetical protein
MSWRAPARHAGFLHRGAMRIKGIGLARYRSHGRNDPRQRRLSVTIALHILEELGVEPLEPARMFLLFGEQGSEQEGFAALKLANEEEIRFQTTWRLSWKTNRPNSCPSLFFPVTPKEQALVFPDRFGDDCISYQATDINILADKKMVVWKLPEP